MKPVLIVTSLGSGAKRKIDTVKTVKSVEPIDSNTSGSIVKATELMSDTTSQNFTELNYEYREIDPDTYSNMLISAKHVITSSKDNYDCFLLDLSKKHSNTFITCYADVLRDRLDKKDGVKVVSPVEVEQYKMYPPVLYDMMNVPKRYVQGVTPFSLDKKINPYLILGSAQDLLKFIDVVLTVTDINIQGPHMRFNADDSPIKQFLLDNDCVDVASNFFSVVDNTGSSYLQDDEQIISHIRPFTVVHILGEPPTKMKAFDVKYLKNNCTIKYNCINLRERTDRLERMMEVFKVFGIDDQVDIFRAERHPKGAMYGCYDSHLKCLERSKTDIIFIFEDDCTLYEGIDKARFDETISQAKFYMAMGYDYFSFGCVPIPGYSSILDTEYLNRPLAYGDWFTALGFALKRSSFERQKSVYENYIGHVHYDMLYMILGFSKIGFVEQIVYQNLDDSDNSWLPNGLASLTNVENHIRNVLTKTTRYNRNYSELSCYDIMTIRSVCFVTHVYIMMCKKKMC
ncbi:hypothetical protein YASMINEVIRUS_477 [Yasminevirus sp. GU-2018]|uniref:Glycosyltransferase family 25 n=1 Tax=Yasminevirus sp. GU-2018 TaxID=2420051 RepID=A0A5K0U961_9VIRU|nr:hypothetical protein YASMINEVIRUS_477 [Yasminevirus sp. GU-2018]